MGARRSNQSTQTLRLSPRQSNTAESAAKPHVPSYAQHVLLPRKLFQTSSTSSAGLFSGLLIYACLAWIFINFSLNYDNDSNGALIGVPVPTSSYATAEADHRSLRHRNTNTTRRATSPIEKNSQPLPANYFQLSPSPNQSNNSSSTNNNSHPWSWPIIHIVNTRFMQGQGTLTSLARSRLKLLEVVTLPSLMKQSIFDYATLADVYKDTIWEDEIMQLNATQMSEERNVDPIFLWIIKVDPNLDKIILDELRLVLEPVKHFTIVVGSNTNYGIGTKPGGWRGGEAGRDVLNAYDTGRVFFPLRDDHSDDACHNMLRRAHDAREDRVVLETRLDADDALNIDYFWTLQYEALWKLIPDIYNYDDDAQVDNQSISGDGDDDDAIQTARWLYWCPNTHVQWNPSTSDASDNPGMLQVFKMPDVCVTAGLTLGFAVGTNEENVPRYSHTAIYWEITVHHLNNATSNNTRSQAMESFNDIHDCGLYPSSQCAVFVVDPRVSAFRSRTMTSAGMHNIETKGAPSLESDEEYMLFSDKLWEHTIEDHFGIQTEQAKEAAKFMTANYLDTVRDNLKGQCTHGHSCKVSSMEKLQRTIDILEEEAGGFVVH